MRSQGSHLLERLENPRQAGSNQSYRGQSGLRATSVLQPGSQRPGSAEACVLGFVFESVLGIAYSGLFLRLVFQLSFCADSRKAS